MTKENVPLGRNDNKKRVLNIREKTTMYYVYILTNSRKTVLYIGVTNNLERRLYEHKKGFLDGFSKKYNVNNLVYYETTQDVNSAISREKQLKSWSRSKKEALINSVNPLWNDLSAEW